MLPRMLHTSSSLPHDSMTAELTAHYNVSLLYHYNVSLQCVTICITTMYHYNVSLYNVSLYVSLYITIYHYNSLYITIYIYIHLYTSIYICRPAWASLLYSNHPLSIGISRYLKIAEILCGTVNVKMVPSPCAIFVYTQSAKTMKDP